jgi:Raf kinase inhibitor-like YbhB/YbcL family protein
MENRRDSILIVALLFGAGLVLIGCRSDASPTATIPPTTSQVETTGTELILTSSAFSNGDPIPGVYTCDGQDISPPLSWEEPPSGTESFALIVDDPDAPGGTWVHWVLFNVPGETRSLAEEVSDDAELSDGGLHGENSWNRMGYGGPCPPSGTHRYFFKLYALDTRLDLEAGASKERLLDTMEGHILAQTELMGTYQRE